jgi:hypothetical protein
MRRRAISCFFIALAILLQFCAPSRFVKPLDKNQKAVSFSFGGPLIKYAGAAIPIPFSTLGYGHGISDRCTAFGNLHTTSLLFGNVQLDAGATFGLLNKDKASGISVTPELQLAYHIGSTNTLKAWPSADINYYHQLKNKPSFLYAGANSWFELSDIKAHGEKQSKHVIPNLHLGYQIIKIKWQHQFELKYLGVGIPNLPNVVDYIGISHKGTFGIYYSLIRKF